MASSLARRRWQPGESSEDNFTASFGLAFHRDQTGKISQAQRELMAAHDMLKKAGLDDAQDIYFWLDPFSRRASAWPQIAPVDSECACTPSAPLL